MNTIYDRKLNLLYKIKHFLGSIFTQVVKCLTAKKSITTKSNSPHVQGCTVLK
jgi:hypothetical protein